MEREEKLEKLEGLRRRLVSYIKKIFDIYKRIDG